MSAHIIATTMEASLMQHETTSISKKRLWAGRSLSGLAALFCLMDGGMKLFKPRVVVEATLQLGYPESAIVGIGMVLLACTILYLIPRTAILGAVLLTGYLGGAVATYVRVSGSWFNTLFPVVFACFVWGGLYLRDQRLRSVLAGDATAR
jgi:DoxX-like family